MAITVQYVVTHKGVEKLVTSDKKEADQYDKMLDIADNLAEYVEAKGLDLGEGVLEELSIMMAKNKDSLTRLLKGQAAGAILEAESADVVKLKANG